MLRLERGLERFREHAAERMKKKKTSNSIYFAIKGHRYIIRTEDILYVSSHLKHSVIHAVSQDYEIPSALVKTELNFPPERFLRIHKSYMINTDHVRELICSKDGSYQLILDDEDDTPLPVGRSFAKQVLEHFNHTH